VQISIPKKEISLAFNGKVGRQAKSRRRWVGLAGADHGQQRWSLRPRKQEFRRRVLRGVSTEIYFLFKAIPGKNERKLEGMIKRRR